MLLEPSLPGIDLAQIPSVPPPWTVALAHYADINTGRRSWDLFADVYGPAYDLARAEGISEAIALCVHFLETIDGEPLDARGRKLVAQLVRMNGKAALYGLAQAVGVTETDGMRDRYRYARVVAARAARDAANG